MILPLDTKTENICNGSMEEEEALVYQKTNDGDSPLKTDKMIIEETQKPNETDEPNVLENKDSIQEPHIPTESNQPPSPTNLIEEPPVLDTTDNPPITNEDPEQNLAENGEQVNNIFETGLAEKSPIDDETSRFTEGETKKNNAKNSLKKNSFETNENPKRKYTRKATHNKYTELVSFLDSLSKFNWYKNYVSGQKISAAKYLNPNVYWFIINAEYFPRNTFAHKNNKESVHNRLYRIKGFTPDITQRLTRMDLKADFIHTKPIEASEQTLLTSFSKAIKHSTESFRSNNYAEKIATSRNINITHKPTYNIEDDEWMIQMRRYIHENYTQLQDSQQQSDVNFDLLSKIDLQDLLLLYEKDLSSIALQNEKEIDELETKISDLIEQEEPLKKLSHDLQDSLVDFKMKFPEEEAFITYLEKKQNEAKETGKTSQLEQDEPSAHKTAAKTGKKASSSMSIKANAKVKLEDAICQICNDADYSDDDLIVFCAKCNIGVHQQCYGIPVLPEGDWICDVCITFQEKGKYLRCPFCDKRGGAMKPTCTRVDTNLFEFANPDFDAFLKTYSSADSVKAFPKNKPPNLYINKAKSQKSGGNHHQQEEDEEEEEEDLYYDFELLDENFTGISSNKTDL